MSERTFKKCRFLKIISHYEGYIARNERDEHTGSYINGTHLLE